ncbi:MAG: ATP-dependent protease ATPase subunit HslU [Deltaproteobacteria bacterium]|nr:ATP-dependent protease ATPase subunit HslU [Deltaproteobacteria bacterium]
MSEGIKNFTPREIVSELDRYIIGQDDAKRAVAIAMRNRWRRQQVPEDLRDEIAPKNIIMIGPTGIGKTEIARRLSKLAEAPFIKVEASKFTEVGYVGKDVESMIRELMDTSVNMVKAEEESKVQVKAEENAEERLLDLLIPRKPRAPRPMAGPLGMGAELPEEPQTASAEKETAETREKMRKMLREGRLAGRFVELDFSGPRGMPMVEVISAGGSLDDISRNLKDMFSQFMPRGRKRRRVKVPDALEMLKVEEAQKLVEMEEVVKKAVERVEQNGIVFIDEIDKIASRERGGHGPEVSREGVQRDILPIVEGSNVSTKYGMVRTDHILFVAAGAFHVSKPSDLIPELQGRFPIRVELKSLTKGDFLRILKEPTNSLTRQYTALMKTEKIDLVISDEALEEIASYAARVNEQMENIGARRLHTIMEKVLDEISFLAPERSGKPFKVDGAYVKKCLEPIVKDQDLSRYIL